MINNYFRGHEWPCRMEWVNGIGKRKIWINQLKKGPKMFFLASKLGNPADISVQCTSISLWGLCFGKYVKCPYLYDYILSLWPLKIRTESYILNLYFHGQWHLKMNYDFHQDLHNVLHMYCVNPVQNYVLMYSVQCVCNTAKICSQIAFNHSTSTHIGLHACLSWAFEVCGSVVYFQKSHLGQSHWKL